MQPQIVDKPAFTLVGMKLRTKPGSEAISQLWQAFGQRMGQVPNAVNPSVCFGATDHFDLESGLFDYLAAVEVTGEGETPEAMDTWQVPAQTYVVFRTTLPKIGTTFDHIYDDWLPQSDYERAAGPEFEYYDETFNPNDPTSEFDIYIPVTEG
jgi:AraC family transcriptional regulator